MVGRINRIEAGMDLIEERGNRVEGRVAIIELKMQNTDRPGRTENRKNRTEKSITYFCSYS